MNSFSEKQLRVTLILSGANSKFPGTNSNTLILTNLRMSITVEAVARLAVQASAAIFGMTQADMNALTVAWANPPIVLDHVVIIEANDGEGWTQVFSGTILEAQPNFSAAPNTFFQLQASTGYFQKINPAPPTSYPYEVDIGLVAQDLCDKMGFTYIDGGATGVLQTPYFKGTLWDQLAQACGAANADFYIVGSSILVTPHQKPNAKARPSVVLNSQSGLIGYPVYERSGLNVEALFNPAFGCGTPLDIESIVPSATGRWYPFKMTHLLESRMPNGKWLSSLQCLRVLV